MLGHIDPLNNMSSLLHKKLDKYTQGQYIPIGNQTIHLPPVVRLGGYTPGAWCNHGMGYGIYNVGEDVGGFYLCSTMWGVYNNHPPGSGSFWGYPLAILINNFKKLLIKISFCCSKKNFTHHLLCCLLGGAALAALACSLRSLAHEPRLARSAAKPRLVFDTHYF